MPILRHLEGKSRKQTRFNVTSHATTFLPGERRHVEENGGDKCKVPHRSLGTARGLGGLAMGNAYH